MIFPKQRQLRALRALRKRLKPEAAGRELQEALHQALFGQGNLGNLTAVYVELLLRDKLNKMTAEERIYRGEVINVQIVGHAVLADVRIVPVNSVEYIAFRFTAA